MQANARRLIRAQIDTVPGPITLGAFAETAGRSKRAIREALQHFSAAAKVHKILLYN